MLRKVEVGVKSVPGCCIQKINKRKVEVMKDSLTRVVLNNGWELRINLDGKLNLKTSNRRREGRRGG